MTLARKGMMGEEKEEIMVGSTPTAGQRLKHGFLQEIGEQKPQTNSTSLLMKTLEAVSRTFLETLVSIMAEGGELLPRKFSRRF